MSVSGGGVSEYSYTEPLPGTIVSGREMNQVTVRNFADDASGLETHEIRADAIWTMLGEFGDFVIGIHEVAMHWEGNEGMEFGGVMLAKNGFGAEPGFSVPAGEIDFNTDSELRWYGWPGNPDIIKTTAEGAGGGGFTVDPWVKAPEGEYVFILSDDDVLHFATQYDNGASTVEARGEWYLRYHVIETV